MLLRRCPLVVHCPVCGRPAEIQLAHPGQRLACAHCRGCFFLRRVGHCLTAERTDGGGPKRGTDLPKDCVARSDEPRGGCRGGSEGFRTSPRADKGKAIRRPVLLMAEHRDEVFAPIATNIEANGFHVVRAESAAAALITCGKFAPQLVLASTDLPDQSGWLLAAKLRIIAQRTCVWLYRPNATEYDKGLAQFLRVDELLDYGGDLLRLSTTIVQLLSFRRVRHVA